MNIRSTFPPLLILIVATLFVTTQPSSAIAPDHGPSAFGQGSFGFFNGIRTEHWEFSFEATGNNNDRARGRAVFNILDNLTRTEVVVKIDCMNVSSSLGSGTARMLGTVLHSDDPGFPKGAGVVFAAEDNSGSLIFPQDTMTPIFVVEGFEVDCHEIAQPLTMFRVGDGITIVP
jgi:hypothetical protein